MNGWISAWLGTILIAGTTATPAFAQVIEYRGMCDASAAIALGRSFLVANDEDNVLRVYSSDAPDKAAQSFDLSAFLQADTEHPEADIEGAARIGNRIYWITSHGASKKAKARPGRRRFFATDVGLADGKVTLTPVGQPYTQLLDALNQVPGLENWKLAEAAKKAPEAIGGLNIEGMAAAPDGKLLIAFRNPIVDKKALIVPLENPAEVINGKPAKLGQPIQLALDDRGIRSIEYFEPLKRYLIVAGPYGDVGSFSLYRWSGAPSDRPEPVNGVVFAGLHPEALVVYPDEKTRVQLLSDDGGEQVDGGDCKDAKLERRSFRSTWVTP